jgi:hypothetical protein
LQGYIEALPVSQSLLIDFNKIRIHIESYAIQMENKITIEYKWKKSNIATFGVLF